MPNMNKPRPGKPVPKPPMIPMTKPMTRPPMGGAPGIMPTPVRPGKPGNGVMENMPIIRDDMKGNGFTPYAAGKKHYGTGRGAPNVGATGNMAGYAKRDGKAAARREALMRRTGGM